MNQGRFPNFRGFMSRGCPQPPPAATQVAGTHDLAPDAAMERLYPCWWGPRCPRETCVWQKRPSRKQETLPELPLCSCEHLLSSFWLLLSGSHCLPWNCSDPPAFSKCLRDIWYQLRPCPCELPRGALCLEYWETQRRKAQPGPPGNGTQLGNQTRLLPQTQHMGCKWPREEVEGGPVGG